MYCRGRLFPDIREDLAERSRHLLPLAGRQSGARFQPLEEVALAISKTERPSFKNGGPEPAIRALANHETLRRRRVAASHGVSRRSDGPGLALDCRGGFGPAFSIFRGIAAPRA